VKTPLVAVSALALLAGAASIAPLSQSFAQAAAPAPQTAPAMSHRHDWSPSRHIEGRIAYVKAELKITPQQEAAWSKVAQAMRDNARDADVLMAQLRGQRQPGQNPNAIRQLEARGRFAALRAQADERLLAAIRPLYASLSSDQQQAADQLFGEHRHHHGFH
jgi:periplasmic protein CpxP/Spy